jgi:pyrimidine-nucleoside phosphorylase
MQVPEIIAKKRDGEALSRDEIRFVVEGYTGDRIPDYQVSALLMAVYLRGMNHDETQALTEAMIESGAVVDFSSLGRLCVDKHSTGGVGDKTSLVVAPVVAAAGVPVPMISGRSLAHSGGTLDKLESIPGFRTDLSLKEFKAAVGKVGAALAGQTREIAPADKKLYALRDVTSTVACRPLMAASILSKKLAEGIDGLVLDVKAGNGAFMRTVEDARMLADIMISIVRGVNKKAVALITDMSQPLGRAVGNSLEVVEAFESLHGRGPEDFNQLCCELTAHMLVLGGAVADIREGRLRYAELIASGKAVEKMSEIIKNQGGDPRVLEDYSRLPQARHRSEVSSTDEGWVQSIDTEAIGWASMSLGAGRSTIDSRIDHSVGVVIDKKIGDRVERGSRLATIHSNMSELTDRTTEAITKAYVIGSERFESSSLLHST